MRIKITVEVEVERVSGVFVSKDEIAEEIVGAIESADPGFISGVGANSNSEYEITDWTVES